MASHDHSALSQARRPSVALADVLVMLQACDMSTCPTHHHVQAALLVHPTAGHVSRAGPRRATQEAPQARGLRHDRAAAIKEGSRLMQRVLMQSSSQRPRPRIYAQACTRACMRCLRPPA
jgi:hypothetical protein